MMCHLCVVTVIGEARVAVTLFSCSWECICKRFSNSFVSVVSKVHVFQKDFVKLFYFLCFQSFAK